MECFLELSAARSKTQASPDTALQALGLPQEQYGYDPVGNRTSSAHQPGFWRYNADNQLTEYPSLQPFSLGALPMDTDVSYTPHGHTEKETNRLGTKEYGYNAAERLIRFSNTLAGQDTADVQADYRYDPFGRRIAKTITQGSQIGTVWFIYNEQGLMAEANEQGELTKAYGFNPTRGSITIRKRAHTTTSIEITSRMRGVMCRVIRLGWRVELILTVMLTLLLLLSSIQKV